VIQHCLLVLHSDSSRDVKTLEATDCRRYTLIVIFPLDLTFLLLLILGVFMGLVSSL